MPDSEKHGPFDPASACCREAWIAGYAAALEFCSEQEGANFYGISGAREEAQRAYTKAGAVYG